MPGEVNPSIPGILVLSHGDMALGMLNSAEMICGRLENVSAVGIEPSDDLDEYKTVLLEIMDRYPAGVLVLIDIMSGTPFNTVMAISETRPVRGIAGVNLPLLIETAMMRGTSNLDEIAGSLEEKIHASVCDLGKLQVELSKQE